MLEFDVDGKTDRQRLIDLLDERVEPLEVVGRAADDDEAVRVGIGLDAEDVGDRDVGAAGLSARRSAAAGGSRSPRDAAALEQRPEDLLHLERVGVLEVVEAEDLAVAGRRHVPRGRDEPLDALHHLGLGADGDRVVLRKHRDHELLARADLRDLARVLLRRARAAALRGLLPRGRAARTGRRRRLEELADVVGDRLRVGVGETEGLGLHLDPGLDVEQRDQLVDALREADVALEDQLVRGRVDGERRVGRDRALQPVEDVRGLGALQPEHLDHDVAVLGQLHHVDLGAEDDRGLDLLHVREHLDHDHVGGLDDADAVHAEGLEEQVERAVLADRLVVDEGDLDRGDLREPHHHGLAGPLDDERDHRLELLLAEAEDDRRVVGGTAAPRAALRTRSLPEPAFEHEVAGVGDRNGRSRVAILRHGEERGGLGEDAEDRKGGDERRPRVDSDHETAPEHQRTASRRRGRRTGKSTCDCRINRAAA